MNCWIKSRIFKQDIAQILSALLVVIAVGFADAAAKEKNQETWMAATTVNVIQVKSGCGNFFADPAIYAVLQKGTLLRAADSSSAKRSEPVYTIDITFVDGTVRQYSCYPSEPDIFYREGSPDKAAIYCPQFYEALCRQGN